MISDPISDKKKLRTVPLQLIEVDNGILLRRGCVQVKFSGFRVAEAVRLVLDAVTENEATPEEIRSIFPPALHSAVDQMIIRLVANRLLLPVDGNGFAVDSGETSLDVFYWHFGETTTQVTQRLNNSRIVILGVNSISRQLASSFVAGGVENFEIIDVPDLRNRRLFDTAQRLMDTEWQVQLKRPIAYEQWQIDTAQFDCVVATSDFGGIEQIRQWNRVCVEMKWPILPVVLADLIGYIGPLVVPGETACYECLYARQNSNLSDYEARRMAQCAASEAQSVIGFHPSMASVLADLATLELTKFYSGILPNWKVGNLIEVKLLVPELKSRKVLKIPRCSICSPLLSRASSASKKDQSAPVAKQDK
jgi:thiazole/oxazole-forming peptide maturase SagC family component